MPSVFRAGAARHGASTVELHEPIRRVLSRLARPIDMATLEYHLKGERISRGEPIDDFDTYRVRDAVWALERAGHLEFTSAGEVRLVES